MDLAEIEEEVARLDAILAPVAKARVDMSDPDWIKNMVAKFNATRPQVGVRERVQRC